jgi:hypothetical protein
MLEKISNLVAALHETSAEMEIERVEYGHVVNSELGAKASAWLATLVGKIVVVERFNRQAAEGHVPIRATLENSVLSNAPRVTVKRVSKMSCLIEFCRPIMSASSVRRMRAMRSGLVTMANTLINSGRLGRLLRGLAAVRITNTTSVCVASDSTALIFVGGNWISGRNLSLCRAGREDLVLSATRAALMAPVEEGTERVLLPSVRTHATVPNNHPTPEVIAMASAPQKVTRIAPAITLAPPA